VQFVKRNNSVNAFGLCCEPSCRRPQWPSHNTHCAAAAVGQAALACGQCVILKHSTTALPTTLCRVGKPASAEFAAQTTSGGGQRVRAGCRLRYSCSCPCSSTANGSDLSSGRLPALMVACRVCWAVLPVAGMGLRPQPPNHHRWREWGLPKGHAKALPEGSQTECQNDCSQTVQTKPFKTRRQYSPRLLPRFEPA
jgi:hypothetical protein